jgi:uncharacterized protein YndB with AHSA1/START domain
MTMSLDPAAHMPPMTRIVRNLERDGKPAKAVIASCVYDTDAADLWNALTDPKRIPRWFLPVSGDLKLGGRYQFEGNAGGTITECVPHKKIAATWEFGGGVSWVTVTLTPEQGGTRFELEHVAEIGAHWDKFGPGAVGIGWELGLLGLASHLADPATAIDPATGAMWPTTREGKAFVRTSSDGWGEADIAAGEAAKAARDRAELTRQFYTGEMSSAF